MYILVFLSSLLIAYYPVLLTGKSFYSENLLTSGLDSAVPDKKFSLLIYVLPENKAVMSMFPTLDLQVVQKNIDACDGRGEFIDSLLPNCYVSKSFFDT